MIPGSHLEKLQHLLRRIEDEIRMEENRLGVKVSCLRPAVKPKRAAPSAPSVESRAEALGLTPNQVKAWGVEQGLIPEVKRGRLSGVLLDLYLAAHPQQEDIAS